MPAGGQSKARTASLSIDAQWPLGGAREPVNHSGRVCRRTLGQTAASRSTVPVATLKRCLRFS